LATTEHHQGAVTDERPPSPRPASHPGPGEDFIQRLPPFAVLDALPDPTAVKDTAFIYRFANAAFCEWVRRPSHEIVGHTDFDLYPPDRASQYRSRDESALATRLSLTHAEGVEDPSGKRWHRVTRCPLLDNTGAVIALIEHARDITEIRKGREVFIPFIQAVEQSACMVLITDVAGSIEYVNRRFTQTTGYSREEAIGRMPRFLKSGELSAQRYEELWQAISTGKEWHGDLQNKKKNGDLYWVSASISPVFDAAGGITHYLAIKEDITERKLAEEGLRIAHRQRDLLLATIPSILIGVDRAGVVTEWSGAAERTFGITAAEVVDRPFKECGIRCHILDVIEEIDACIGNQRPARLEDVWFLRTDGSEGFLGITLTPLQDEEGRPAGCVLLAADVTDRKSLESQLSQAQKLESIGQLAAGIAHEINTPTQYVGDNARFLRDAFTELSSVLHHFRQILAEADEGPISAALLEAARTAAERADLDFLGAEIPLAIAQSLDGIARVAQIVRAMKDFSHPGSREKTPADLNRAIESTITVSRNEWKYVADMVTDLDPELPLVPCLPAELNQVILNMITNAAHAIADVVGTDGGKGKITISTRRDGDWVEVRIADTGTGIPPDAQPKVFDPFFTTKAVGRGTGQGLAIARSVVLDKHHGEIAFTTENGRGTTFVVRLPLVPGACDETST